MCYFSLIIIFSLHIIFLYFFMFIFLFYNLQLNVNWTQQFVIEHLSIVLTLIIFHQNILFVMIFSMKINFSIFIINLLYPLNSFKFHLLLVFMFNNSVRRTNTFIYFPCIGFVLIDTFYLWYLLLSLFVSLNFSKCLAIFVTIFFISHIFMYFIRSYQFCLLLSTLLIVFSLIVQQSYFLIILIAHAVSLFGYLYYWSKINIVNVQIWKVFWEQQ